MVDQQQNDNPVLRFGVMAFYFVVALSFPIVLLLLKGCFGADRAVDAVLEARSARVAVATAEQQAGVDSTSVNNISAAVLQDLAARRGAVTSVVVPGSPTQLSGGGTAKGGSAGGASTVPSDAPAGEQNSSGSAQ